MFLTKKNNCPKCNFVLDAATSLEDICTKPRPGDITICINCGSVLKFTEDFSLEALSEEEISNLDSSILGLISSVKKSIDFKNNLL